MESLLHCAHRHHHLIPQIWQRYVLVIKASDGNNNDDASFIIIIRSESESAMIMLVLYSSLTHSFIRVTNVCLIQYLKTLEIHPSMFERPSRDAVNGSE